MNSAPDSRQRIRLGIVVSHPIQYQAPLYRRLAQSEVVDPDVLFLSDHGVQPSFDEGFGREVAFDVPLTSGYRHEFLRNIAPRPAPHHSLGVLNPQLPLTLVRSRFDAVLVHGYALASHWLAFAGALTHKIPYLLRGESRIETDLASAPAKRILKRTILGPLFRRAGCCLAIGSSNRAFYQGYGVEPERLIFAPYSVDNTQFAQAGATGRAQRRELLDSVGLDDSAPTILFAGHLQPWKRPMDFVGAVERMRVRVNALVIGDGPLFIPIKQRADCLPQVRMLGFVNQSEIGQWYGAADVFVLPSEREQWGLAVNEAMAAGAVPVVSDAVGCAPDLITPQSGRTVPVGNVGALAGVLDDLLVNPSELAEMRKVGQRILAGYSIEATARGVERGATIATTSKSMSS